MRWPRLRLWRWLVVGPREEWHVLLGSWLLRTGTWASTIILSSPLCILEFSLNTDRQFCFRLFIVSKFGWPFMLLPRPGLGQAWLRPGVTSVILTTPSSEVWCHRHSKCVICIYIALPDHKWCAVKCIPCYALVWSQAECDWHLCQNEQPSVNAVTFFLLLAMVWIIPPK